MSFSLLKYQAVNRKYFIIQSTSALHWALDLQILISNLYKPWDLTKSSPNLIWATFTLYIQRNSFSALWTGHMSQYDLSPTKSHHLFTRWWASVESVFLKDIPWLEVIFNVIRYLHLDPAFLPQGSPLNLFFAAARRFFAAIQFTFKGKLLTSNKLMISLANGSSSTHMPLKSSQLSFYYLVSS